MVHRYNTNKNIYSHKIKIRLGGECRRHRKRSKNWLLFFLARGRKTRKEVYWLPKMNLRSHWVLYKWIYLSRISRCHVYCHAHLHLKSQEPQKLLRAQISSNVVLRAAWCSPGTFLPTHGEQCTKHNITCDSYALKRKNDIRRKECVCHSWGLNTRPTSVKHPDICPGDSE